jgi:hypothetical protein
MTVLGCVGMMIFQPLHILLGFAVLVITGALDRQTISTGIDWSSSNYLCLVKYSLLAMAGVNIRIEIGTKVVNDINS